MTALDLEAVRVWLRRTHLAVGDFEDGSLPQHIEALVDGLESCRAERDALREMATTAAWQFNECLSMLRQAREEWRAGPLSIELREEIDDGLPAMQSTLEDISRIARAEQKGHNAGAAAAYGGGYGAADDPIASGEVIA